MDHDRRRIIIVTHVNPDLDSVTAVWLLTRFVHAEDEWRIQFVPIHSDFPNVKSEEFEKIIYVDTGGGEFDHHGTPAYTCAADLVMKKFSLGQDAAISRIVEYVLAVDHGRIFDVILGEFDLVRVIEGLNVLYPDKPNAVMDILLPGMDGIFASLTRLRIAEEDLEKASLFATKWGKGAAASTSNEQTRYLAHRKGFKVFIFFDPVTGYRGFTSPGSSDVDFSEIYVKVRALEPNADWFLHSSRQLLLCGSKKAPDRRLSSLSLGDMITLIKS